MGHRISCLLTSVIEGGPMSTSIHRSVSRAIVVWLELAD